MSIEAITDRLPDFAKDIKLNLSRVLTEGSDGLNTHQLYGIALASAYASKQQTLIKLLHAETETILTPKESQAAKIAASIMAMNNVYYRFTHLVNEPSYQQMPAQLRMNVINDPGIDKASFELMSLAVSSINGCGMCMDSHRLALEQAGANKLAIQTAVRIAAVISSTAQVLTITA